MQNALEKGLSNEELLSELRLACAHSNAVTVYILRLLIETEDRRLYALDDRKKSTGLATLCLGGGNAVALSVEKI